MSANSVRAWRMTASIGRCMTSHQALRRSWSAGGRSRVMCWGMVTETMRVVRYLLVGFAVGFCTAALARFGAAFLIFFAAGFALVLFERFTISISGTFTRLAGSPPAKHPSLNALALPQSLCKKPPETAVLFQPF